MKILKNTVLVLISISVLTFMTVAAFCDGTLPASASVNSSVPYSYVLMEGKTSTLLYADNGNAEFIPYHSSKLMTLLLLCEAIEREEISLDTVVTVSKNANSQKGASIWLDTGEKILVSELVWAITVGNANDACVAIAEAVSGDVDSFVKCMNRRAEELGMTLTHYEDATGMADGSKTTACDLAILASELSKYAWTKEYFTTWMTSVRGGKAELVSQNRLIRTYKDLTGMKAYYHKDCGNCLIASADKNGLTLICVILGDTDEYERFKTAKEKFNIGFSAYTMYTPKAKDFFLEPVYVKNGVVQNVETEIGELKGFVVRTSKLDSMEIQIEYYDNISAPIEKGSKVGRAVYTVDKEVLFASDIVASEKVDKITPLSAIKKLLVSFFAE